MAQRYLTVYADYETSAHAGAEGMFQIIEVREGDEEIDRQIDCGIHFSTATEVETYLEQEVFPGDDCDVSVESS